ncbi:hypothetical protein AHAS_Ahas16G0279300 [Arachis hypogaea]
MTSHSLSVPYLLLPKNRCYEWKNILNGHVGTWCVGSSHGWIILLDQNGILLLLNPSSSTTINLPPCWWVPNQVGPTSFKKKKAFILKKNKTVRERERERQEARSFILNERNEIGLQRRREEELGGKGHTNLDHINLVNLLHFL